MVLYLLECPEEVNEKMMNFQSKTSIFLANTWKLYAGKFVKYSDFIIASSLLLLGLT